MDFKRIIYRILFYILGLFILAFGVSFSVNSDLGVSPVNSLPYEVSLITDIKLGTCVTAVFCCYILMQIVIKRKEFRLIDLTQVIFSTIFGYFTDLTGMILGDFCLPGGIVGRLVMAVISMILIAIGISMYVNCKLVPLPMEGLTLAITDTQTKRTFQQMKVIVDCIVVVASLTLSLVFLHGIQGVGVGTVLAAIFVGKIMQPVQKILVPIQDRICFPKLSAAEVAADIIIDTEEAEKAGE